MTEEILWTKCFLEFYFSRIVLRESCLALVQIISKVVFDSVWSKNLHEIDMFNFTYKHMRFGYDTCTSCNSF